MESIRVFIWSICFALCIGVAIGAKTKSDTPHVKETKVITVNSDFLMNSYITTYAKTGWIVKQIETIPLIHGARLGAVNDGSQLWTEIEIIIVFEK